MNKIIHAFVLVCLFVAGCDQSASKVPTAKKYHGMPPGATNFTQLDNHWYTYEYEGNKILVHVYYSSHVALEYDSVIIKYGIKSNNVER